jgi:hypothetical protein
MPSSACRTASRPEAGQNQHRFSAALTREFPVVRQTYFIAQMTSALNMEYEFLNAPAFVDWPTRIDHFTRSGSASAI